MPTKPEAIKLGEADRPESTAELDLGDAALTTIESKMRKDREFGTLWGFHEQGFARPERLNEAKYMLPGTLDLIEQVVQAESEGRPYDTIVFLDKSARPGAHLFNVLARDLKKRELLPNIDFPEVKFMDLGKQDDPTKLELLDFEETRQLMREILPEEAEKGKMV